MRESRRVHPVKVALQKQWPPMSQAKFARAMQMSEATLSKYLQGDRQPPEGFYLAAAEVLGVPVDQLKPADEAEAVA